MNAFLRAFRTSAEALEAYRIQLRMVEKNMSRLNQLEETYDELRAKEGKQERENV